MPSKRTRKGRKPSPATNTLKSLKPGETKIVENDPPHTQKVLSNYARRHNIKFKSKSLPKGLAIWLLE